MLEAIDSLPVRLEIIVAQPGCRSDVKKMIVFIYIKLHIILEFQKLCTEYGMDVFRGFLLHLCLIKVGKGHMDLFLHPFRTLFNGNG